MRWSSGRSWTWSARWASRQSPRALSPPRSPPPCARWAARPHRAGTSASRGTGHPPRRGSPSTASAGHLPRRSLTRSPAGGRPDGPPGSALLAGPETAPRGGVAGSGRRGLLPRIRSAPRTGRPRMACMSISRTEVAHLARLSRMALSEAELDHFAGQLDQILTAVARVQEVAAEGIEPTTHAAGLSNVFREDRLSGCLGQLAALDQAP